MSAWVTGAIFEAIEALASQGRADLATDLKRLTDVVDLSDIDALRSPQADTLADCICDAEGYSDLSDALSELCEIFEFDHATFHVVSEGSGNSYASKVITTYPDNWINEYIEFSYFSIDPVIEACERSSSNFHWCALDKNSPLTAKFAEAATNAGIGPSGYSCLIETEIGDKFALSVTSTQEEQAFCAYITEVEDDLMEIGRFFSRSFFKIATSGRPTVANPTTDQLRLLRAVATGSGPEELEKIDFMYGSARTVEKSICLMFRTKTLTEAAVLAARLGLLDSTPLERNEIFAVGKIADKPHRDTVQNVTSLRRWARRQQA